MTNNKQSSVEWLVEILGKYNEEMVFLYQNEIEQAKAMHRKEIITAYSTGLPIEDGVFTAIDKAHKYYDKTFDATMSNNKPNTAPMVILGTLSTHTAQGIYVEHIKNKNIHQ